MHDNMYCMEIGSPLAQPPPPLVLELHNVSSSKKKVKNKSSSSSLSSCYSSSCVCDDDDRTMLLQQMATTNNNTENDKLPLVTASSSAGAAQSTSIISHFEVQGICCSSELPLLKSVLKKLAAFEEIVSYNPTMKKVVIQHSSCIHPDNISTVLRKHGYVCRYLSPLPDNNHKDEDSYQSMSYEWLKFYLLVFSGLFWLLSLLSNIVLITSSYEYYFGYISFICGLPPILRKTCSSLRQCYFDANCMMFCASLGSLLVGEAEEAASVVFLFSLGEYLEHVITSKGRKALENICNKDIMHARVIHNHNNKNSMHTLVPASQVDIGSKLLIIPAEKVPCDGRILEGFSTYIDESLLTGESKPIYKTQNDKVISGSINIGPSNIVIITTNLESESTHTKFTKLIENAASQYKSSTEKYIDNFARIYTPFILCIAFIMCTIPWMLYGNGVGKKWFHAGLILIAIACPCALTIATPVTYVSALTSLASHGIVVRGGSLLESLGHISTVVFDKTGTLTYGLFHVQHLETIEQENNLFFNHDQILSLLAQMEEQSSHPLSHSIVNAAREKIKDKDNENLTINSYSVCNHTVLGGEGVTAKINNKHIAYVGNERLFNRLQLLQSLNDEESNQIIEWKKDGGSVGFFGVENIGILAMYCVFDRVRTEALDVVNKLNMLDLDLFIFTGDSDNAAKKVGSQLGLNPNNIKSQLLPEEKLKEVMSLMNQEEDENNNNSSTINISFPSHGKYSRIDAEQITIENQPRSCYSCLDWRKRRRKLVLMVGDGLNDAPALTAVDVGVAMGSGAAMAMEVSDVTLMDSRLDKLVLCIEMGKRVNATIIQNMLFALLLKSVIIILTLSGKMTLLAAIGSDVGGMLLVILNGIKLLSFININKMIDNSGNCIEHNKDDANIEAETMNPLMNSKIKKVEDDDDALSNVA